MCCDTWERGRDRKDRIWIVPTENNTLEVQIRTEIISKVQQLVSGGEWGPAVELLRVENGLQPNTELEREMVELRIRAFRESNWPDPAIDWPPAHGVLPAHGSNLPEIEPSDLTVDTLRSGIMGNGALIVRGLMNPRTVAAMRSNIDCAVRARQAGEDEIDGFEKAPWYTRSPQIKGRPAQFALGGGVKSQSASIWAVDSPRTANQLIQFYRSIKLPALLEGYFSEPAALSVRKWVLRRVAPDNGSEAGWHQDGQFLGDGIRTVNLWIALTECGGGAKAPGMDIIGGGNRTIHETGTRGACFNWTVGQGLVDELSQKTPVQCPRFLPGDALFFDHYNLHRTGFGSDHTQVRYALESWFFASSRAPAKQVPVFF